MTAHLYRYDFAERVDVELFALTDSLCNAKSNLTLLGTSQSTATVKHYNHRAHLHSATLSSGNLIIHTSLVQQAKELFVTMRNN